MEIISRESPAPTLNLWWRRGIVLILIIEFSVLIWITTSAVYMRSVPPVPSKVTDSSGSVVFTGNDIKSGQQILLRRGLMNNGTVWGHGAYLGPDFSAQYLHNLALGVQEYLNSEGKVPSGMSETDQKKYLMILTRDFLEKNRYDASNGTLLFTEPEKKSFNDQLDYWRDYFQQPNVNRGLSKDVINSPEELRQLNAFFAWTAWASAALAPGKNFSYTNNFPHEPLIGNGPSSAAILWSAMSLITLLGGIALILFFFGRYEYLGWKSDRLIPAELVPGNPTAVERSTIKFLVVAVVLLLIQTLAGGALAHYFAESKGFGFFDISTSLPSNVLRSWHLQSGILWIATAYIAGGLVLSSVLSPKYPKLQVPLINFLFIALAAVVGGSLLGEYAGIKNIIREVWFWFGNQGWEYLEIGRVWQLLMAVGLIIWVYLIYRAVRPSSREPEERELKILFVLGAFAIPLFYLPAFFIGSTTHFSTADTWRFWIIHLWVEGFFEVFATIMVAILFYKLGLVRKITATRLIYLDAILFLGAGILGTGHHWYWNGQTTTSMAISACFSAMEVVPLILLTLEASDFYKLRRLKTDESGKSVPFAHKWAFFFLVAVGVWNFIGAGVFGFLINLPVISYYETGTNLTPNHGHGALMGVFGMLALGFMVFALRQVSTEEHWKRIEKYVKVSFWGLNIGLAGMLILQLFPSGVMQFVDSIRNGYWHARSLDFTGQPYMTRLAWLRLPADVVFIVIGVLPLLYAVVRTYLYMPGAKREAVVSEGV